MPRVSSLVCVVLLSAAVVLLLLSVQPDLVDGLVFQPTAPTIVSVTSPYCTTVETAAVRSATSCQRSLSAVPLQLKGVDWNGILQFPTAYLITPLNSVYNLNCELDNDWGVVTVGHEAWEVSCQLNFALPWYEQQGGPMGLQIADFFSDPSPIFYGLSTSTAPLVTSRPVLYSVLGCLVDCRPLESLTITGVNFAGLGTSLFVVAVGQSSLTRYALNASLSPVYSNNTVLTVQLPASVQSSDLNQWMTVGAVQQLDWGGAAVVAQQRVGGDTVATDISDRAGREWLPIQRPEAANHERVPRRCGPADYRWARLDGRRDPERSGADQPHRQQRLVPTSDCPHRVPQR